MYLTTGELIAIMIALIAAPMALGYALYQNKELIRHNNWLMHRNRELNERMSKMVELPW